MTRVTHAIGLLLTATLLAPAPTRAQTPKPVVQPADYARWESLGQGQLSPDGAWLAYAVNRVNEENELRVLALRRDTTIVFPQGSRATFSNDSRWLAVSVGVPPAERERLEREKKPVRQKVALLDLRNLQRTELGEATSFAFSEDGGSLAFLGYTPAGSEQKGADLIVRDLRAGTLTPFGNITEYAWSDSSPILAMTVETTSGAGNGVQLWNADASRLRVLDSSGSVYRDLAWREKSDDLAVLRQRRDDGWSDDNHVLIAWTGVRAERPARHELAPAAAAGIPDSLRIAEHRRPEWSKDGGIIAFGLRPREAKKVSADSAAKPAADSTAGKPAADSTGGAKADGKKAGEKKSDVQIWHAKDFRIFPMQAAQEQQDLRRTLLAVWHVADGRVVRIGTDLMENARLLEGAKLATETDGKPYAELAMFGRPFDDIWLIDTRTGERTKALEKVRHFYGGSATGRWLLWFEGDDFHALDTRTRAKVNLTEKIEGSFADAEYDYPVEQLPPHGLAGWTKGDASVLVYDRYDIWRLSPDGSGGTRLTEGARDSVVNRVVRVRPDEDGIDLAKPLYLSLYGDWSKKYGYGRIRPNAKPERLVFEDERISRLTRADSTDVFAYVREDFDDSPDWFAGAGIAAAPQVSRTNPFMEDYAWGHSELIEYTSQTGRRMQGALLHPANRDASRKYPMIVYHYEILSPNVHNFVVPSERSYYNLTAWTQQGYFVLLPDIVYRARDPGRSAVEAEVPAVAAVVAKGLVDPAKVGLIGHSWGGYEATYVPTQTDIFAAAVAGAPLTNFLSMMGAIHWRPGLPETGHWETGQARMDVPFWEDFDAHVRNSPAAFIDRLNTPMLMEVGDDDGTVDFRQGIEFYNYARRAGKTDFVLLLYPGEDHGLRKKENQIDYHRRINQWFGHWLKGEAAPGWMTEGQTFLERKTALGGGRD